MKKIFLFFVISIANLSGAVIQMKIEFDVFQNTAPSIYPSVDFDSGERANFSFVYDTETQPNTGSSSFSILGSATLEIDGFQWTTDSYQITLIDGDPQSGILTPTDSIAINGNFVPESPFSESFNEFSIFLQSSALDLTFLSSEILPEANSHLNVNALEIAEFSLIPPSGTLPRWIINGIDDGDFNIDIQAIPEPSIAGLFMWPSLLAFGRRRRN